MTDSERKRMIREGFDTVAANYDHPALGFFPQTAALILDTLQPPPTASLLDVCTGTGAVALQAAARNPGGSVVGVDISAGMLAQARKKGRSLRLRNVVFRQMDLEEPGIEGAPFDIATCSFGLFFVDDMDRALKNIAQSLKPGGRLAITSFAEDAFSPFANLFLDQLKRAGAYVPPLSWKKLSREAQIGELLTRAGIGRVEFRRAQMGYELQSEHQWWDVVWNAGFRGLLNQLSETERRAFADRHLSAVRERYLAGERRLNIEVVLATGTRV